MKKDTLLETLKSNSVSLTAGEIEAIMNEELTKSPDEMDCELIDLCSDVLEKAYADKDTAAEKFSEKRKRIKFGKIMMIAAAVIVILGISVPVCAKFVHTEASNEIVQYFNDHFKVDNSSRKMEADIYSDKNIDLVKKLNDFGFENVIIPAELFSDDYTKEIKITQDDESFITVCISFKNASEDLKCDMFITKHKTEETQFIIGTGEMGAQFTTVRQLTVNGMDVLIFETDDNYAFITYADTNIEYDINIRNCDMETAIRIAETLEN